MVQDDRKYLQKLPKEEVGVLCDLIRLLKAQGRYPALISALETGQNHYAALWPSRPINARNRLWVQLQEGQGMPFQGQSVPLDASTYLEAVVLPIVRAYKETHPDHPFDDRKFRLCHYALTPDEQTLQLSLGPTVYQHYREDMERPRFQALERMLQGMQEVGDPYHFFSKMMGITVIILSKEGYAFVGERVSHVDHPGLLQFVAGAATFHTELSQVNFWEDIQSEILQETGWEAVLAQPKLHFIGIAGQTYTSELDLIFVLPTTLEAAYFEHPTLSEHERMLCIQTRAQARRLLNGVPLAGHEQPSDLLYPTYFGLTYLLQHYWR